MDINSVFEKVKAEADSQIRAYDEMRDDLHWFMLLSEEVGEVAKAMNDNSPVESVQSELVQVAMLAMVWHSFLESKKEFS